LIETRPNIIERARGRRRAYAAAASALAALGGIAMLEIAARAFWRIEYQLSFRRPNHVLYAFYPELKGVDEVRPSRDDGHFNILMLGGSVFHPAWGQIEPALAEQLDAAGVREVRIFNMGVPAHTSRDSLLKYTALGASRFNLVLVYHGVNDTRANNIPPELFRSDYSHYGWYAAINAVARYHGTASFALPYTWHYAMALTMQNLHRDQYAPTHEPRPDWVQYGGNLLSVRSFEDNLTEIAAIARARRDPLMLMTFAYHVPSTYSREAFMQKTLDYRLHRMPIEVWGRREYVTAALAQQNEVVRHMVATHRDLLFVDQAMLMEASAENFDDPVHFTIHGSVEFASHVVDAIQSRLCPTSPGRC